MIDKQVQNHILSTIVENKPGVLFRVTNMIRRRGFNIENLSVGALDEKLARMTIVIRGDEKAVELITKNLQKLVETLKVVRLNTDNAVIRELALIKVHTSEVKARSDLIHYAEIFRGRVVDVSTDSMTIEITGEPKKIDAFLNLIKGLGVKEFARTGITALARGSRFIHI